MLRRLLAPLDRIPSPVLAAIALAGFIALVLLPPTTP